MGSDAPEDAQRSNWSLLEAVVGEQDGEVEQRRTALRVSLPGEVRLELSDAAQVSLAAQLIETLRRTC